MPTQRGTGYSVPVRIDPTGAVAGAAAARKGINSVGLSASRVTTIVRGLVVALGGVTGGIALALAIRQISQFEESMAKVRAVTGATAKEFENLNALTRRLGATTVFTAKQAGEAALFLGRAGFTSNEILQSLTQTLLLARAGGIELEEAADITVGTLRGFNLAATESARVVDVLAVAAASANTTILELGQGVKFVAPVAQALGVSLEETVAAMGRLSDAGLKSTIAGTGLRRVLSGIVKPLGPARKLFDELGIDLEDLDLRADGLVSVIRELANAGVGAAEALQLFGQRGGPAFLVLKASVDSVEDLTESLIQARGEARRMALIMDDTLAAALKAFVSAVSESVIALGDAGLNGSLRSLFGSVTGIISVWNGMTVEFAAANQLTIEQTRNLENLANTVKTLTLGILTLVGIPLAAWLLRSGGALAALLNAAKAHPVILALSVLAAAYSAFASNYDTAIERLNETNDKAASAFRRIREIVGEQNYARGTLGGGFAPADEALTRADLQQRIAESVENEASAIERTRAALDLVQSRAGVQQTGGNLTGGQATIQQLANEARTLLADSINAQSEDVREAARSRIAEIGLTLQREFANLGGFEFGQDFYTDFAKGFQQAVSAGDIRIEGGRLIRGFDEPVQPDLALPTLPGSLDAVNQAHAIAAQLQEQNEQGALEARARAGGGGLRESATRRAAILTDADFAIDRERETRQLEETKAALDAYIASTKELDTTSAVYKAHVESIDAAQMSVDRLDRSQQLAFEARRDTFIREGLEDATEQYDNLLGSINQVTAAETQLRQARQLLDDLGIDGDERAKVYGDLEKSLADQRFPIQALIDAERERLRLVALTGEEQARAATIAELNAINFRDYTQTEIEAKAEQILQLREQADLEERIGRAKSGIQQQFGVTDPNADPSARSVAGDELYFGSGEIDAATNEVIQAQERLRQGFNGNAFDEFRDGFVSSMDVIIQKSNQVGATIGKAVGSEVANLGRGIGQATSQTIVFGTSIKEAFGNALKQAIANVIAQIIALQVELLIAAAIKAFLAPGLVGGTQGATRPGAFGDGLRGAADGGFVRGPGGPRDDSIIARVSNGEFVVNAEATKRNRALLEAINNDQTQRFQAGGLVGNAPAGGGSGALAVNVTVQNETRTPIDVESQTDEQSGQIVLVVREALAAGVFDSDLEAFGAARQPEQ